MTHIKGEIIKTGYSQPVVTQQTNHSALHVNLPATGIYTFALSSPPVGKTITIKKISASTDDVSMQHAISLLRYPGAVGFGTAYAFFWSYFYVTQEWTIGDTGITLPSTWAIRIVNNAAGNFTINVYWIES